MQPHTLQSHARVSIPCSPWYSKLTSFSSGMSIRTRSAKCSIASLSGRYRIKIFTARGISETSKFWILIVRNGRYSEDCAITQIFLTKNSKIYIVLVPRHICKLMNGKIIKQKTQIV